MLLLDHTLTTSLNQISGGALYFNGDFLAANLINLFVLNFGVFYLLGAVVSEGLSTRQHKIRCAIEESEKKLQQAENVYEIFNSDDYINRRIIENEFVRIWGEILETRVAYKTLSNTVDKIIQLEAQLETDLSVIAHQTQKELTSRILEMGVIVSLCIGVFVDTSVLIRPNKAIMMSEDYRKSNIEKKIKLALCDADVGYPPSTAGWATLRAARIQSIVSKGVRNTGSSLPITNLQKFYQDSAVKVVETLAQHGRVAFSSAFSSALDDRTVCLNKVARPYAEALLGLAKSNDLLEEMTDDMRFLEALMESNQFQTLLTNPSIAKLTRMEIVNSIFKPTSKKESSTYSSTRSSEIGQTEIRTLEAYSLNLILLLNHLDLTEILEDVVKEFINLSSREQRIVDVRLTSSGILLPENTYKIKDLLKGITGARKVNLLVEDDPSSFGGFKIEFGSAVIDLRLEHTLGKVLTLCEA